MSVRILNTSEYEKEVLGSEKPVLVDFFATWCMPCKMLAPVLDSVSEKLNGEVDVVKVDIDENMGLARKYGIMSVPTMIVVKNGVEVDRMIGFRQANQILETIEKHK